MGRRRSTILDTPLGNSRHQSKSWVYACRILQRKVYPSSEDQHAAEEFLRDLARPVVALHVGSGSEKKNWRLENWIDLGNHLLASDDFHGSLVIVSGEADEDRARHLQPDWKNERVHAARNQPLPQLAGLLEV